MATSKIKKELLIKDIPYSAFEWLSNFYVFQTRNAVSIPSDRTFVGFLCTCTNGTATMAPRLLSDNKVVVSGWYPTEGTRIESNATFTCKMILQ